MPHALVRAVRTGLPVRHAALRAGRVLRGRWSGVRGRVCRGTRPGAVRWARRGGRGVRRGLLRLVRRARLRAPLPDPPRTLERDLRPVPLGRLPVLRRGRDVQRLRRTVLGRLVRRSARVLRPLRQLRQFHGGGRVQHLRSVCVGPRHAHPVRATLGGAAKRRLPQLRPGHIAFVFPPRRPSGSASGVLLLPCWASSVAGCDIVLPRRASHRAGCDFLLSYRQSGGAIGVALCSQDHLHDG